MKPEWRTTTVVQICQTIRETGNWSALPILADALQDAGCDDETMLGQLRGRPDEIEAQRLVALIYSDKTAEAVKHIEQVANDMGPRAFCEEGDGYGQEVPTDYARLMRVGNRWTNDSHGWGYTTEHGSESLRDRDNYIDFELFWEAHSIITGKKRSEGNPFSCTC